MIVLLVDLQILPGDRRQFMTTVAQRMVQVSWERWNVGLDRPSLFAVRTLGARVETVQDFTWDPDLVLAALAKVAQQPVPPTVALTDRTESLGAMCSQLADTTPSAALFAGLRSMPGIEMASQAAPKAVYYFDDDFSHTTTAAPGVSAVSPETLRKSLLTACTRPNVRFTMFVSTGRPPVPPVTDSLVGVSVRIVPHQTGSPVSIVESTSDLEDGYASVVLRDDADKAIRSVTLGALALPLDPAMTTPQVFIRRGPNVTLLPRATVGIAAQLIDASALTALARKGANIEIGVVGVEFADGSTWSYDLAAKGRFERH